MKVDIVRREPVDRAQTANPAGRSPLPLAALQDSGLGN